jgi:glutamate synthase domain-containing protein 3
MNDGKIVVHGHAGDITGYAARGGKIFIRGNVGYRTGIHMKEYMSKKPYLVVGGTAQDFLGEYMAGGVLLVLGLTLKADEPCRARFVGTGMHGGVLYMRGEIPERHLGKEVKVAEANKGDLSLIQSLVNEFCGYFNAGFNEIMSGHFLKIVPFSHRPYGRIYAY